MPLQNMPITCKGYFELKSLEKQQVPERLSDLSFFFLKAGDKISIWKMPYTRKKVTLLSPDTRSLILVRIAIIKRLEITNIDENVGKRESLCTGSRNTYWYSHYRR